MSQNKSSVTPFGEKRDFFDPARVFLFLAFLIGAIYCVVIPYGAGFDEERHIVRISDMAKGYLVPNRNPPGYKSTVTYKEFADLSYQRRIVQSPAFDMFSEDVFGKRFGRRDENLVYGYVGGSIYSPVIFIPQALVARIFWEKFDFPILPVVILMRSAGLVVYIGGCWLAIQMLPIGKWVMTVLALSPMALFQAVTLNADGFTNAASFLFIGLALHVYASGTILRPHWIWALIGSSLIVGMAKPGAFVLLPLLLIFPRERFASTKWMIVLYFGALLAVLVNLGWMSIVLSGSKFAEGGSDSLPRQFDLVMSNFSDFIVTYMRGLGYSFVAYYKDWIAAYGYWAGDVPEPVYWFYTALLFIAITAQSPSNRLNARARIIMAGTFLLSCAAILTLYFITYYSPGDAAALGRHGRYFIPFAPLFYLALSGLVSVQEKWKSAMRLGAVGSFLVMVAYYSFGIYTSYYTFCGYDAYAGNECVLPVYKNLEKEEAREIQVNVNSTISQSFTNQCNGLKEIDVFVKSIPAAGEGDLRFSLLDEYHRLVSNKDISISQIRAGEYLTLPVHSIDGLKGSVFEIKLEAPNSASSNGIGLGAVDRDYHDGNLLVAGNAFPGDLIFHYTCVRP